MVVKLEIIKIVKKIDQKTVIWHNMRILSRKGLSLVL